MLQFKIELGLSSNKKEIEGTMSNNGDVHYEKIEYKKVSVQEINEIEEFFAIVNKIDKRFNGIEKIDIVKI